MFKQFSDRWKIRRDPVAWARSKGVQIGEHCRLLGLTSVTFGSEPYLITLGDHVTITEGVLFSTHDGGVWTLRDEFPDIDIFGRITVGTNVFIGFNSIILPGVAIGDNCVVGAGSVVTRDIPPGSVAAGTPAKVIRSIAEYREKAIAVATHIRSQNPDEKRRTLMAKFKIAP